jgi:hypothetical protein
MCITFLHNLGLSLMINVLRWLNIQLWLNNTGEKNESTQRKFG